MWCVHLAGFGGAELNKKYDERKGYHFKKLNELVAHTNDWSATRIKKRSRRLKQYKEAAEARRAIKK
ncbi:hypothetical protein [Carnobacterium maltaromaticum]|uniref:hypothetical protein n=1 Tax=Carnobacterium maltaromaticum TaxID=2751 RepID=UPI001071AC49|nr:hypothetical protein [Carnobacterium maltaromaticum]MDT1946059.1 hypothetical protein [Carnobacterium maltaromaticum]MDT2000563.1 hypothetical protein [Carnobacterium maltaromaticum]